MSQTSRDRVNSRRVRTHEENSGETVRRLGTIIQNIFCAQSGASIRLTFGYGRPPYSEDHLVTVLTFCSEFAKESILLAKEQLLIVGDMHHVDDASEAGARNFLDLLESLGLKQHVRGPTHIHGHTLDLVVTRLAENIILDTPKADRYLSDHSAILRKLTSSKPLNTVKEVMYQGPSLLISPPFRVIWGSHRYVGMFFPILIQTSSVLATWILLPVIITPLCLALSNHTRHLKRRPLYQGLLYPGTMTTYSRQSFYAER